MNSLIGFEFVFSCGKRGLLLEVRTIATFWTGNDRLRLRYVESINKSEHKAYFLLVETLVKILKIIFMNFRLW